MTENEAIEKLKNMRLYMQITDKNNDCKFTEDDYKANETAIQALEEVQQYRTIGTLDIDKVVKQLEDERELSYADFNRYVEEVSPCLDAEYDDSFQRGLERAIKIIKAGGING